MIREPRTPSSRRENGITPGVHLGEITTLGREGMTLVLRSWGKNNTDGTSVSRNPFTGREETHIRPHTPRDSPFNESIVL